MRKTSVRWTQLAAFMLCANGPLDLVVLVVVNGNIFQQTNFKRPMDGALPVCASSAVQHLSQPHNALV